MDSLFSALGTFGLTCGLLDAKMKEEMQFEMGTIEILIFKINIEKWF